MLTRTYSVSLSFFYYLCAKDALLNYFSSVFKLRKIEKGRIILADNYLMLKEQKISTNVLNTKMKFHSDHSKSQEIAEERHLKTNNKRALNGEKSIEESFKKIIKWNNKFQ